MAVKFREWDPVNYINSPKDAQGYLEACVAEDPGDGSLIRAALNDVARAQNISKLARDVDLTRRGLYKALSPEGNPSFATMLKVVHTLGFTMRIELAGDSTANPDSAPVEV